MKSDPKWLALLVGAVGVTATMYLLLPPGESWRHGLLLGVRLTWGIVMVSQGSSP